MPTTRRQFLSSAAATPFFAAAAAPARLPIRKAVEFNMLPRTPGIRERFQFAKEAGFEAIECPTTPDAAKAEEMLAASNEAALPIHSVMNSEHWNSPLSSADPAVVEKSLEGMRTSLRNAKLWGADTVLLVPAVVNPQTSYAEAWERSQRQIRKLIPQAEELKVIIAIEEVWNKFLLSPLEMARYVDEFQTPWIRSYFDIGNVAIAGYPAGLDPHAGQEDREAAREGLRVQETSSRVHAAVGGRDRLEGRARRAGGDRISRHRHGGTLGRRRRVFEGSQPAIREDLERRRLVWQCALRGPDSIDRLMYRA